MNTGFLLTFSTALLAIYCSKDGACSKEDGSVVNQQTAAIESQLAQKKKLKILLYSVPIAGHYTPILVTGEELARRGHNVTLCTGSDLRGSKIKQLAERVGVSYMSSHRISEFESLDFSAIEKKPIITKLKMFLSAFRNELNVLLLVWFDHLSLDQQTEEKWDAILADDFLTPALLCIHKKTNIPVFLQSTTIQSLYQPSKQWFVPSVVLGNVSAWNPSFFERIKVFINGYAFNLLHRYILFLSESANYCSDVSTNVLIPDSAVFVPLFIPTVIGFEYPRTLFPMTHYLGPLLSKSPDPLPQDLEQWLTGRQEKSVVYISMGSMFSITHETGEAIVNGLLQTNYSVVWALRQPEILEGLEINSKRVFIINWAPQLSVLQHKAISMAIMHGGANGLNEALYNGVPLIVTPIAGEQIGSGSRVTQQGLGVMLDVTTLTAEKITSSINEIDSGDYRRNVERLQKIFISAGGVEKAADLVEYYKDVGFDHLIPAYAKYEWSWIQYYNVDVYGLLAVILVSVIYCSLKCCQCVCRRTCCWTERKEKKD